MFKLRIFRWNDEWPKELQGRSMSVTLIWSGYSNIFLLKRLK